MQLPTIPKFDRLTKAHKFSAAGIAAAGVGVLAITGVTGTSGTAQASGKAAESVAERARAAAAEQHAAHAAHVAHRKVLAKQHAAHVAHQAVVRERQAQERARKAADEARRQERQAANRSHERKALVPQQRQENSRSAPRAAAPQAPAAPSGTPQQMAQQIIGDAAQFQCFSSIVMHESTWNPYAVNPSSGAYGLVQALPGAKMASAGADWRTNPATQIKWGLDYMNERYGSPCGAWSFWQANHWY
ncbi:aggregation-promoting factor C-terminal-like domain-containing protein [Actinacidiphila glaucinigra]|uniref:Transglycosylase SLT domain-containing protein n=1 Tax=Actinacidiphila glaucinigra TaxID=235986 RepID=A0A239A6I1_9ACTN|nr:transglycosylase SLT domain-containing protein [Actinacidiphila glaucinigra]SNR90503.1 Transglycosylase SLT domain-containing protein [Actinacidiphila glaucinigra]